MFKPRIVAKRQAIVRKSDATKRAKIDENCESSIEDKNNDNFSKDNPYVVDSTDESAELNFNDRTLNRSNNNFETASKVDNESLSFIPESLQKNFFIKKSNRIQSRIILRSNSHTCVAGDFFKNYEFIFTFVMI